MSRGHGAGAHATIGLAFLAVTLVVATLGGCGRSRDEIALPETPVLSGRDRYALVVEAYVRVHSAPGGEAPIRTHLRLGDVLPVESRTPDDAWVEIRRLDLQGWIQRSTVRLFSSREQAINARRTLDS